MDNLVNVLGVVGGVLYLFAICGALGLQNKLHRSYFWSNLFSAGGGTTFILVSLLVLLKKATFAYQLLGPYPWMSLSYRLDNLAAFFLFCLSLLTVFVSIYTVGYHHHRTKTSAVVQPVFIVSLTGLLCSADVISFLVFWEVMSFSSYFLIVSELENHEARRAGNIYLLMTQLGTSLIFIVLMGLAANSGSTVFDKMTAGGLSPVIAAIMFVCALAGFGTKAGMVPLHIWLPKAHPAAPTPVSALMSGFMIKAAVYGLIRFGNFFPIHFWQGTTVVILGVFTALVGIIYAFMENDYKRLLAYCSIENIGVILLGFGGYLWGRALDNPLLTALGLVGLEMHVLNHTFFKGLMFMSAGAVIQECKTRSLEKMGGLIKRMPQTALFTFVGSATGAGLPFTSGFISEWIIFQTLFLAGLRLPVPGLKITAFLSIGAFALVAGFAAATFVKLFGIGFLALPRSASSAQAQEAKIAMRIGMGLPALCCVLIGIFPVLALNLTAGGARLLNRGLMGISIDGFGTTGSAAIAPAVALGILAVVIGAAFVGLGKKGRATVGPTWNCGTALQPQMEYGGASFSKMAKLVFKFFLQPKREIIRHYGKGDHFATALEYQSSLPSHFEEKIYQPAVRTFIKFSDKIRWLQAGSIKLYLSYILIVLIALLLYLRLGG